MKKIKNILLPFIICSSQVFCEEVKFLIKENIPFPEKIKNLQLMPTQFDWSMQNNFILVDHFMSEILQLTDNGKFNLSTKSNWGKSNNSEIVWVGVSNQGVKIIDKLSNSLTRTDFNLNPTVRIDFDLELYPEQATEDYWGNVYLYSQSYGSIFILENSDTRLRKHIDLNKLRILPSCLRSMNTNDDGYLGVLGCEGNFFEFSKNGLQSFSYNSKIKNLEFLVPFDKDWLLLNKNGLGELIKTGRGIRIPLDCLPIYDIKSKNNSLAILSKNQIIILHVN